MFDTGSATHIGKVRELNEDSCLARPEIGVWAVADGMGGHADGDIASQTVIRALASIERPASAAALLAHCEENIACANLQLRELGRKRGDIIGSTVAILLIFDGYYACVWSGDSRIYMVRDGTIVQLSRDHTEVEQLLAEESITAEEAANWNGRNGLTRAIGVHDEIELEMTSGPLNPDDIFAICSDGLTNHLKDHEILRCVSAYAAQAACDALIALALERGALDNVTVVIAHCRAGDPGAQVIATDVQGRWK